MSIFPIITDDELTDDALAVFEAVNDKFGSIPIFYRLLALAPPLLEAYWLNYKKVILEGVLPPQIKELVYLAVARKRRCIFSSSAHLAICDILEADRQTITAITNQVADFSPRRVATLINFCLLSMDNPSTVSESDYQSVYDEGISQVELIEALFTVAYADTGIFLAKALKVDVDIEIKTYLDEHNLTIGFI